MLHATNHTDANLSSAINQSNNQLAPPHVVQIQRRSGTRRHVEPVVRGQDRRYLRVPVRAQPGVVADHGMVRELLHLALSLNPSSILVQVAHVNRARLLHEVQIRSRYLRHLVIVVETVRARNLIHIGEGRRELI